MDKTFSTTKNLLKLVKPLGESKASMRKVVISERSMSKARFNSKALGWLYATVEIGWRFLIKSKTDVEPIMGSDDSHLFPSDEQIPSSGLGLSKTLSIVENEIAPNLVKTQSPNFMGHMTSDIPFPVHLADILISFFNQNLVKAETAGVATNIEKQTISWFHRLTYGFDEAFYTNHASSTDKCLGVVVSGGTMGNITALTVARNIKLPESKTLGVYESMRHHGYEKAVILCSQRAHYSLKKAASLIGLGEHGLVTIPVHKSTNKIDVSALESMIDEYNRAKTLIIAMVGIAGTTETGNVDQLSKMADLAQKHKIWFHVDAAWAGGYLLSSKLKNILSGIEMADSVVIDGHKLVGLTMGHGMTLFKNQDSLDALRQSANYIIRANSSDLGKYSLEGSKPFASFKLWFYLKAFGIEKIAKKIEATHKRTMRFSAVVEEFSAFEITNKVETNILTYRFAPKKVRQIIKSNPTSDESIWLLNTLNRINETLHREGRASAPGFVSRTQLESCVGSDVPHVVFRAIPINSKIKNENVRNLLAWQMNRGYQLLSTMLNGSPYSHLSELS